MCLLKGGVCVCGFGSGGGCGALWLHCMILAAQCNVSAVQYRDLSNVILNCRAPPAAPADPKPRVWPSVMLLLVPVTKAALSLWKGVELLVCDFLLGLRTMVWQRGCVPGGGPGPVSSYQLAGFQRDLSSMRRLGQCCKQAQGKVLPAGQALNTPATFPSSMTPCKEKYT